MATLKPSKSDLAFEFIKSKIIDGTYAPMTALNEAEIITALNSSRTPVREAILRLKSLSFVYIYPNSGTLVSEISRDLIDELFQIRYLNEPALHSEVARYLSRDEIEQWHDRFSQKRDRQYYIEADDGLHDFILSKCKNRFIRSALWPVYEHNKRLRRFSTIDIDVALHLEFIEALGSREDERIRRLTLRHLGLSEGNTLDSFVHGDYKYRTVW